MSYGLVSDGMKGYQSNKSPQIIRTWAIIRILNDKKLTTLVKKPQNLEMERKGTNLKNVAWSWEDHIIFGSKSATWRKTLCIHTDYRQNKE